MLLGETVHSHGSHHPPGLQELLKHCPSTAHGHGRHTCAAAAGELQLHLGPYFAQVTLDEHRGRHLPMPSLKTWHASAELSEVHSGSLPHLAVHTPWVGSSEETYVQARLVPQVSTCLSGMHASPAAGEAAPAPPAAPPFPAPDSPPPPACPPCPAAPPCPAPPAVGSSARLPHPSRKRSIAAVGVPCLEHLFIVGLPSPRSVDGHAREARTHGGSERRVAPGGGEYGDENAGCGSCAANRDGCYSD